MNPRRISVKLFASENIARDALHPYIGIFHRFIQEAAVPGLLLDVADYAHVPDGPGIMLIGHDVDYAIDLTGGRTGLLATRKRAGETSAGALFEETLAMALATARALEDDEASDLRVASGAVQVSFPDRLDAPNDADAYEAAAKELEPVARKVFGDAATLVREGEDDPRRMLTIRISGDDADVATRLGRLGRS